MSRDLSAVHPVLVAAVERILTAMAALGFPMLVTDTVRTTAEQQALYQQGRNRPGRIVTNADGVRERSNHQVQLDGYGHAVDCCFLVDGKPTWAEACPWRLYGEAAKALGLRWGGDWPKPDRPHIEMPEIH